MAMHIRSRPVVALGLAVFLVQGAAVVAAREGEGEGEGNVLRIELRPAVEAPHADVTLGEVANMTSRSLPLLQQLMALPIGQLPRNGDAVQLDRQAVRQWVRVRFGLAPEQMAWSGPALATVRLAMTRVTGDQLAEVARTRLVAGLQASGLRAEVAAVQVPRDVMVPGGQVTLSPRSAPPVLASAWASQRGDTAPPRRQTVWVDLWVDGRFARAVAVAFEVDLYGPGYVAVRDLAAGQTVAVGRTDSDALALRDVNWSAGATRPVPAARGAMEETGSKAEGQAMRLRHPMNAGQTLTRADVEPQPSVVRGNFATLRTQQGAIALESRVEVLQDAALGQAVRVKLPSASTSIVARVTGAGNVEVRE